MKMTGKIPGLPAVRAALLAASTVFTLAAPMLAQDAPPPSAQQGEGRGAGMQERQLEHMTKALDLTPDQVSQVKVIQTAGRQQMMALRDDTSTAGPDKRARMMSIRDTEQGKIKAVLTDAQKSKYDAMMAKMRERRQEHGDGPPPPPPPPSN